MRWLVLLCLVGCGDDGGGGAPIDAPVALDTPLVTCPTGTARRTVTIVHYGSPGGVITNAEVCPLDRSELCATSTGGTVEVCAPDQGDFALTVRADGHEHAIYLFPPDSVDPLGVEIGDNQLVSAIWEPGSATYPPTSHGLLFMQASSSTEAAAGATLAIAPATGSVMYGGATQQIDPSLTATSASGMAYAGDLPPGEYDITVTPASPLPPCRLASNNLPNYPSRVGGWASPTAGAAVRAPVRAGFTTVVWMRCQ